jgi:hypothetical protein
MPVRDIGSETHKRNPDKDVSDTVNQEAATRLKNNLETGLVGGEEPTVPGGTDDEQSLQDLEKSHKLWEVEYVRDHKYGPGKTTEYLLKWKGYPVNESTWEPRSNILEDTLINEYWLKVGPYVAEKEVPAKYRKVVQESLSESARVMREPRKALGGSRKRSSNSKDRKSGRKRVRS